MRTAGRALVPVAGRKPKPEDQRRNRVKPRHDWTEYPDLPHHGGPPLPLLTPEPRRRRRKVIEPMRPLGPSGRDMWDALVTAAHDEPDRARLLVICETQDERASLRATLFKNGLHRADLRLLDAQLYSALNGWCDRHTSPRLMVWPRETQAWWDAVSTLPHAVDWTDADWRFAMDTAYVHAAVMNGDLRVAAELRTREKVIGTTVDARRDLRIRYVPPVDPATVENPSVTAMADYRRSVEQ